MSIKKVPTFIVAASMALMASSAFAVEIARTTMTPEEERCHRRAMQSPQEDKRLDIFNQCREDYKSFVRKPEIPAVYRGKIQTYTPPSTEP